jgi:hypothetical protein
LVRNPLSLASEEQEITHSVKMLMQTLRKFSQKTVNSIEKHIFQTLSQEDHLETIKDPLEAYYDWGENAWHDFEKDVKLIMDELAEKSFFKRIIGKSRKQSDN